jgi:hypothetical protein
MFVLLQDPMYFFLVEYLARKEQLSLDIAKCVAARASTPAAVAEKKWLVKPPQPLAGVYFIPESIYERDARRAGNRKEFDKAQNKGEIPPEVEWEEESDGSSEEPKSPTQSQGTGPPTVPSPATSASSEDAPADGSTRSSRASSAGSAGAAAASAAPFGYMTGPYRAPPAVSTGVNPSVALAASLAGLDIPHPSAACNSSPLIHLDFADTMPHAGMHGAKAGAYGSGNPTVEGATTPGYDPQATVAVAAAPEGERSEPKPLRLVVYRKYQITLLLIVEDQAASASAAAAPSPAAGESSPSDIASTSALSSSDPPQPPLSFYSSLETFMESNLKKLGELLGEQSARLGGGGGSSSSGSTASAVAAADEPYRFLYFNHMNLALKTSLSSTASKPGTGGSVLTMDTIKIIRELHRDFNTSIFKKKAVAAQSTTQLPPPVPAHLRHAIQQEGSQEVCVKTKHHGWVIGRRASQSHREFFLLLEDKVATLADVQGDSSGEQGVKRRAGWYFNSPVSSCSFRCTEEVDNLARTYFYNIFIH